jgi:hypothetical protein
MQLRPHWIAALAALLSTGTAHAAEILVTSNITSNTTWTANNTYNLQTVIYVTNGATLTIEAGTVVASTTGIGGALVVTRGAKLFVQGTAANPVIMTSKADVATWTGGNPKTGTWRQAALEWGNLTIMGDAYISENAAGLGNVPTPSPSNKANMEGLVNGPSTDQYGGGNDDDDSGTISYLSLRYGGKVVAINTELNGLSLGGIGRETDIHHVEVMNNVDDGIEVWGGTVNLKYFSIWNVGDDSLDVDQGWRGKAQFGLIVQGHSLDAAQGSGVGDNCFETDGAENSSWQPVTTAAIYNCTVIGQPVSGDDATAWRDNARVQYRKCVFMDMGEQIVQFDNIDGDGGSGYGFEGTLSWPATWTTDYSNFSSVNAPANPADFYKAQTSGKLAEISDSVFFRNLNGTAYNEATTQGVFNPSNNNVIIAGSNPTDAPIVSITRGAPVSLNGGTLTMLPVTSLDPRPANAALVAADAGPIDGFFSATSYRGAFAPGQNWLCDWTASYAFGFTPWNTTPANYCVSLTSSSGCVPVISGTGSASLSNPTGLTVTSSQIEAQRSGLTFWGVAGSLGVPFQGGTLCVAPALNRLLVQFSGGTTGCTGSYSYTFADYLGHPNGGLLTGCTEVYSQTWFRDPPASSTVGLTNGLVFTVVP